MDLGLGNIVYILVIYNISFFWLLPLDGFQFNLLLGVSENDLLCNYSRTSPLARGVGGGGTAIYGLFNNYTLKSR